MPRGNQFPATILKKSYLSKPSYSGKRGKRKRDGEQRIDGQREMRKGGRDKEEENFNSSSAFLLSLAEILKYRLHRARFLSACCLIRSGSTPLTRTPPVLSALLLNFIGFLLIVFSSEVSWLSLTNVFVMATVNNRNRSSIPSWSKPLHAAHTSNTIDPSVPLKITQKLKHKTLILIKISFTFKEREAHELLSQTHDRQRHNYEKVVEKVWL